VCISQVMRAHPLYLRAEAAAAGPGADPETVWKAAFRKALDAVEDKVLVLQKYRAGEARLPDGVVDRVVASILENEYDGNRRNLLAELAERKTTYEEWRKEQEENVILNSMRALHVNGNAVVSPTEVAAEYERVKDSRYHSAGKVRVYLAATKSREAAEGFLARLAAGEDFGALAKELSSESHADRGGDCGAVEPEEEFAPAICDALAGLAEGGTSDPIEIGSLFYVVRRGESTEAGTVPLADAYSALRAEILARKREEAFRTWVGRLRAAADVRETLPY
ncbi:MAG: peptidyl-prolyl cis-trans isomerase, partial [Kiritimatiellae bacterium]|nr:peptidyl-prolyl cis-trans isomerase [Kiritimatiellia bacterium]